MNRKAKFFDAVIVVGLLISTGCAPSDDPTIRMQPGEHTSKSYYYASGNLMRIDDLNRDEEILRSQWFTTSGEILAESVCNAGTGYELMLHENGSVRLFVPTQNWLYDGTAVYFDDSGIPVSYSVYSAGKPGPKMLIEAAQQSEDASHP